MQEKITLSDSQRDFWERELNRNSWLTSVSDSILLTYSLIEQAYLKSRKLLICGNGGSSADADHIVGELMKGFEKNRPISDNLKIRLNEYPEGVGLAAKLQGALPAINLSAHTSLLTAFANDVGYAEAYAQQVIGYGNSGDVFWAISTSGNSENIVLACITAKAAGLSVIAMTGEKENRMSELADVTIRAPSGLTRAIQDMHSAIYHIICVLLEMHFWPE